MILAKEQTGGRYTARSGRLRRMRAWQIEGMLSNLDAELARVLPDWEREAKAARPVERKPAAVWDWNKALMTDERFTKTALAVAFAIGTYATSETGERVFPSDETIGKAVGIRRQNVNPYRRKLVESGYLQETARIPGGSVTYRLTVPVCAA